MFAITNNLKYLDLHLLWSMGTGAKVSTRSSEQHQVLIAALHSRAEIL